ncbi:MAG: hypothetical protein P8Y63_04125, partial [Deltaproteobacteria bacterium]
FFSALERGRAIFPEIEVIDHEAGFERLPGASRPRQQPQEKDDGKDRTAHALFSPSLLKLFVRVLIFRYENEKKAIVVP